MYAFGRFRYDAEQRILFRDGEIVPLVPKAVDTLHVLIEHRGRIVDKAELMRLVWRDTTVEEVGLARNISLLRKALGEDSEAASCIETIPKRGYRFTATAQTPQKHARRRWPFVAIGALVVLAVVIYWQFYMPSRFLAPGRASLAAVPFECLAPGAECGAFTRGFDELLATGLSKLDAVQVVAPSTVRRHQRAGVSMGLMGRLLGLDALVEGTVQLIGDRVRINSRLVDVHTGKLIWAQAYEYPSGDLTSAQEQAARTIAIDAGAHLLIHGSFPRASR